MEVWGTELEPHPSDTFYPIRTTTFTLGKNFKGHLVQSSISYWTLLSSRPSKRCSSWIPPKASLFSRTVHLWGDFSIIMFFSTVWLNLLPWLSNHWLKLDPQLPYFFLHPSALQTLLLSHTAQFSVPFRQVSLQQMHVLLTHVLPSPSLRPRHFREINLSQSMNEEMNQ